MIDFSIHKMRLNPEPFENLLSGKIRMEYRLYDQKRRKIFLGDWIEFSHIEDPSRTIQVKVRSYMKYPTFRALFEYLAPTTLGPEEHEVEEWTEAMYNIYTPEEEAKYGVVGLLFDPLKKSE